MGEKEIVLLIIGISIIVILNIIRSIFQYRDWINVGLLKKKFPYWNQAKCCKFYWIWFVLIWFNLPAYLISFLIIQQQTIRLFLTVFFFVVYHIIISLIYDILYFFIKKRINK